MRMNSNMKMTSNIKTTSKEEIGLLLTPPYHFNGKRRNIRKEQERVGYLYENKNLFGSQIFFEYKF